VHRRRTGHRGDHRTRLVERVRIVLSRKGVDSSAEGGGTRSPLLPDGTMLSIPIPESAQVPGIAYRDIRAGAYGTYADVMRQLRIAASRRPHLDPDLDRAARPRMAGWRGMFGQANQAQTHLRNQGVGPGDLVVFFGRFRRAVANGSALSWTGPDFHAIWGYLQVDQIWDWTACQGAPVWARQHPHVDHGDRYGGSVVYTAAEHLTLGTQPTGLPGFGRLRWHDDLRLTAPDARKLTDWELPMCVWPDGTSPTLSYHENPTRWTRRNKAVRLNAVGRGQEFVMRSTSDIASWLLGLLQRGTSAPK
jgi:hypothetical protein